MQRLRSHLSTTTIKKNCLVSSQSRYRHTLPALLYPVNGGVLPCFGGNTLTHHYNKHHAFYVEKLNQLTTNTPYYAAPLEMIILDTAFDTTKTDIFQNAAQHFNHSFFWRCIKPSGSGLPSKSSLSQMITAKWGSLENFEKEFTNAALNLFGSGWVYLVIDNNKQLSIWTGSGADTPIANGLAPVLVLDVWEHAYVC
jgi:Fe-Mn family superoxide dismutase